MGPILSILIIGLGGWVISRFLSGDSNPPRNRPKKTQAPIDPKDLPKLKKDPKTGVYRPEDE
ncbi:MAG TPA: hypothetical protein ENJ57_01830 [Rhizobiales bacterium]|nr:hypothetical protein [Hyphomicrobiales bacterium]